MNPYDDIARAIADAIHGDSGHREARVASAHALFALLHVEIVALYFAMRRELIDDVHFTESTGELVLRQNGACIKVTRFSGQCSITFQYIGFDTGLVPDKDRFKSGDVSERTLADLAAIAKQFVEHSGRLLRAEYERRSARR